MRVEFGEEKPFWGPKCVMRGWPSISAQVTGILGGVAQSKIKKGQRAFTQIDVNFVCLKTGPSTKMFCGTQPQKWPSPTRGPGAARAAPHIHGQ